MSSSPNFCPLSSQSRARVSMVDDGEDVPLVLAGELVAKATVGS